MATVVHTPEETRSATKRARARLADVPKGRSKKAQAHPDFGLSLDELIEDEYSRTVINREVRRRMGLRRRPSKEIRPIVRRKFPTNETLIARNNRALRVAERESDKRERLGLGHSV